MLYFDGDMEVMEGGSESGFFQVPNQSPVLLSPDL